MRVHAPPTRPLVKIRDVDWSSPLTLSPRGQHSSLRNCTWICWDAKRLESKVTEQEVNAEARVSVSQPNLGLSTLTSNEIEGTGMSGPRSFGQNSVAEQEVPGCWKGAWGGPAVSQRQIKCCKKTERQ